MRSLNRAGWSLIELLVVISLAGLLAGVVSGVVLIAARTARGQVVALDAARTQGALLAWWRIDLRDSEAGDVAVPADDRLVAHHPVGSALPCERVGNDLLIARLEWGDARDPDPSRDEAWLLRDAATAAWDESPLLAVTSSNCPDGRAALRLSFVTLPGVVQLLRIVEPVQLRLYRSGISWWLGLAPSDGSTPVQPFAGPVIPAGSRFVRDNSGVHVFVQPAGSVAREFLAPLSDP